MIWTYQCLLLVWLVMDSLWVVWTCRCCTGVRSELECTCGYNLYCVTVSARHCRQKPPFVVHSVQKSKSSDALHCQ